MISLIIPVLNEEENLRKNFAHFTNLKKDAQIIFVDGGSSDASLNLASQLGKVLKGEKGRALQMNLGARQAEGSILLFLHADSFIKNASLVRVVECIKNGAVGGCFMQRLDNQRPIYRTIEGIGNRRAKSKKIFYGDQGIFVKKDIFFALGGFPETPVMEDVLFSKRLRTAGRVEILNDLIYVSTRRWERDGFLKTNMLYIAMSLLFFLHVPSGIIKAIYKDVR